jgi:hypothetical protein
MTSHKEDTTLQSQREKHKRLKFLRAWFNMKLTRRNRPTVTGYTSGS